MPGEGDEIRRFQEVSWESLDQDMVGRTSQFEGREEEFGLGTMKSKEMRGEAGFPLMDKPRGIP